MRTRLKRPAICILMLCCITAAALGQQYSFKDYVDGLGNLSVNCVLQDRAGFLWIGTENGLYEYDGSRFWEFDRKDGLPGDFVRALSLDRDGRLWVGTRSGLAVMKGPRRFSSVTYLHHDLKIPYNSSLAASVDGTIYAVTQFGLLAVKSPDEGLSWEVSPLFSSDSSHIDPKSVSSVLANADGSVFFGCGRGLCELSQGELLKYGPESGLPADVWKCLLRRANGELWARGPRHIAMLEPGAHHFEVRNTARNRPGDATYLSLTEDRAGDLLASFGSDVGRYAQGHWTIISEAQGFGKGTVSSIIQDREGSVWFGLLGHGIRKWLGYGN
ncbi:MAG: two-component regulator propeller domain-containing protein, partial [Bryobacteraceae bacterium]